MLESDMNPSWNSPEMPLGRSSNVAVGREKG